jgi:hypothetical protein
LIVISIARVSANGRLTSGHFKAQPIYTTLTDVTAASLQTLGPYREEQFELLRTLGTV